MTNYLEIQMKMRSKKRIFYLLLIFVIFTSCAQKSEDTIRILPEGFLGPALIIFNQKDGAPKEYEDNKRIYRIPKNGILRTQFKPNYGLQDHEFYYINDEGIRFEIPFIPPRSNFDSNKNYTGRTTYAYLEQALGKTERYDPDTKELIYTIEPSRTFFVGDFKNKSKDYRTQMNFVFKNRVNDPD